MRKLLVLALVACLAACGGNSSPTAAAPPVTTPPARDGVIVLNGAIGGRFLLSSSPARLSRSLFGCGDAEVTIPYRETAGGSALVADYELRLLEFNDDSARTVRDRATNLTIAPGESGTIRITERFVCIEYTDAIPPRASVAMNFGGTATGAVSQVRGVGPLTVIN